jgi:hypothetical protein
VWTFPLNFFSESFRLWSLLFSLMKALKSSWWKNTKHKGCKSFYLKPSNFSKEQRIISATASVMLYFRMNIDEISGIKMITLLTIIHCKKAWIMKMMFRNKMDCTKFMSPGQSESKAAKPLPSSEFFFILLDQTFLKFKGTFCQSNNLNSTWVLAKSVIFTFEIFLFLTKTKLCPLNLSRMFFIFTLNELYSGFLISQNLVSPLND